MGLAGDDRRGENLNVASSPEGARIYCFIRVSKPSGSPKSNERRWEVMKIQTFVIGSVLALALFLFAQHRPETSQPGGFREVVDLTHSLPAGGFEKQQKSGFRLETLALSEK